MARFSEIRIFLFVCLICSLVSGCSESGGSTELDADVQDGLVSDAMNESDDAAEPAPDSGGQDAQSTVPDSSVRPDQAVVADGGAADVTVAECRDGEDRPCPDYPDCDGARQVCANGVFGECQLGDDVCDGEDNDCDGQIDEAFFGTVTSCGLGICRAEGETRCIDGQITDTCVPLEVEVGEDVCDGQDSDCDGRTDEDFEVTATQCGRGVCQGTGERICERGVLQDTCRQVTMPSPEVCDGLDNNCDGEVDNELGITTCGLGPCRHEQPNCVDGVAIECDPMLGASVEVCDQVDNDCDGEVDDGLPAEVYYADPDEDGYYGPVLADAQASCSAWLDAGQLVDGVYLIDPDGADGPLEPIEVYCDMSTDGGGWTRVFFHDTAGGYFMDAADARERAVDEPQANRYSILSYLDALRSSDGSYEFRLNWPDTTVDGRNMWRQTSNPADDEIEGYAPIDIDYEQAGWGGLERNRFNESCFIDGTVGDRLWFYAIGTTAPWGAPPGIPSYGIAVPRVALWVRTDDSAVRVDPEQITSCEAFAGYAQQAGDCNAENDQAYPGAEEVCDGIDNDCDGEAEENLEFRYFYPDEDGDGVGVAVGDQCVTLYGRGARQDGVYTIEPEGSGGPALDVYCDMTRDGGGWTRVFYHDVAVGYWGGDADAIERNVANPLAPRYSILSYLESFRSDDGAFDFRLEWPETNSPGRNIWRQTSNPTSEAIAGYEPVQVAYTNNLWGGLEYNRFNNASFIDGSVGHQNWYYAVGSTANWQGGIPAHTVESPRVALWVRPDIATPREARIFACGGREGFADASGDCDDADASIVPGAVERCDGIDNDCDGIVDNDCPVGDVTLEPALKNLHFFPRDLETNTCAVTVNAAFDGAATALRLVVRRDGAVLTEVETEPDSTALTASLEAGLHLYEIDVYWGAGDGDWRFKQNVRDVVCGDVFLIDGQSNSTAPDYHGQRRGDVERNTFVRSFGSAINNSNVSQNTDFNIAVADAGLTLGSIGQWGMRLANEIKRTQGVPVMVINGGVGGTRIDQHQRNAETPADYNSIYGRMLWRAQQAGVAEHVRAIFWHQGESDGNLPYEQYLERWTAMYEGWLLDYPNLQGVFNFQVRSGCGNPTWNRDVHKDLPTLLDRVLGNMSTTGVRGHDGCHFFHAAYAEWGVRMARIVRRALYGEAVDGNIDAPNVLSARWTGQRQITLEFGDTGGGLQVEPGAQVYFSLSDGTEVAGARVVDTSVVLTTRTPSQAATLSFIDAPGDIPWIVNDLGIGAFSFNELSIERD